MPDGIITNPDNHNWNSGLSLSGHSGQHGSQQGTQSLKNTLASPLLIISLAIGLAVGYYGGVLSTPARTTATTTPQFADRTMVVVPGLIAGPDNQTHDAFTPTNFTVILGQTVNLTIVNYDTNPHSFTSTSLGLNLTASPAPSTSAPSYSVFLFTPTRTGVFRWWCAIPCDPWAMASDPRDGQPGMIGYMGGFVTVLAT